MTTLILILVRLRCYLRHPLLVLRFRAELGRFPDPACPSDALEKYLWRKIFDRDPAFPRRTDKLLAKEHALATCPGIRVARTLWVGTDPEEIPDDLLCGDVVVKANHGSSWNYFIRDGEVDRPRMESWARSWIRKRWDRRHGEWGYRDVTPRLFVEELLPTPDGPAPDEYKCYVGSGRVAYVFAKRERHGVDPAKTIFDREGRSYATTLDNGEVTTRFECPAHFDRIVAAAETLGAEFDAVRCDLYDLDGVIYFSEYTFYSLCGYAWIGEKSLMALYDRLWDLRRSWFLRTPRKGWRRLYAAAFVARHTTSGSMR